MKCVLCLNRRSDSPSTADMTRATARAAIDFIVSKARPWKLLEVCFGGAEPLLRFDLMLEATRYLRSRGEGAPAKLRVTSRGTELTDDMRAWFVRERVEESFDDEPAPGDEEFAIAPSGNVFASERLIEEDDAESAYCLGNVHDPKRVRRFAEAGIDGCVFARKCLCIAPASSSERETASESELRYANRR